MAFDLGEMLKGVSDLDTGREQIDYIRLDLIDQDPNNFYQLSNVEELADNIATCGLQQPIRVRRHPEAEGRYMIVSGHRRRAAVELLAKEEPEKWQEVPCIVERDTVSPSLQQLRLIYANSSTRTMTPAEISEQAVQVEKLLYQLKEEGYEFPGRMRDHVAKAVNASTSKLARLKVIREKLDECWLPLFEDNSLAEMTAYLLAQLPQYEQFFIYDYTEGKYGQAKSVSASVVEKYKERMESMQDMRCPTEGIPCENVGNKREATIRCGIYDYHPCDKCCAACYNLTSCKYACPKLAEQIAQAKQAKREQARQEKADKAAKDAPIVEQIQKLWTRFGALREKSGKSVKEVVEATGGYYSESVDGKHYPAREQGKEKIDRSTMLPYCVSIHRSEINALIKLADLFGCSLDYMLCRTDEETPTAVPKSDTGWQTGTPVNPGRYVVIVKFNPAKEGTPQKLNWDGNDWTLFGESACVEPSQILGWMPMPEPPQQERKDKNEPKE